MGCFYLAENVDLILQIFFGVSKVALRSLISMHNYFFLCIITNTLDLGALKNLTKKSSSLQIRPIFLIANSIFGTKRRILDSVPILYFARLTLG
jgi:hypothetical protein